MSNSSVASALLQAIDIVALASDYALFVECKWQEQPVKFTVVQDLVRKSQLFNSLNPTYWVIGKQGFDFETDQAQLIDLDTMYPSIN